MIRSGRMMLMDKAFDSDTEGSGAIQPVKMWMRKEREQKKDALTAQAGCIPRSAVDFA